MVKWQATEETISASIITKWASWQIKRIIRWASLVILFRLQVRPGRLNTKSLNNNNKLTPTCSNSISYPWPHVQTATTTFCHTFTKEEALSLGAFIKPLLKINNIYSALQISNCQITRWMKESLLVWRCCPLTSWTRVEFKSTLQPDSPLHHSLVSHLSWEI